MPSMTERAALLGAYRPTFEQTERGAWRRREANGESLRAAAYGDRSPEWSTYLRGGVNDCNLCFLNIGHTVDAHSQQIGA